MQKEKPWQYSLLLRGEMAPKSADEVATERVIMAEMLENPPDEPEPWMAEQRRRMVTEKQARKLEADIRRIKLKR